MTGGLHSLRLSWVPHACRCGPHDTWMDPKDDRFRAQDAVPRPRPAVLRSGPGGRAPARRRRRPTTTTRPTGRRSTTPSAALRRGSAINTQADPHHQQREAGPQDPDRVVELPQHRDRPCPGPRPPAGRQRPRDHGLRQLEPRHPQRDRASYPRRADEGRQAPQARHDQLAAPLQGLVPGRHGIAHTKFYTFDKVQRTRYVAMYGSANATLLAATIQWNDIYTVTKSRAEVRRVHQGLQPDAARPAGQAGIPALHPRRRCSSASTPSPGKQTNGTRC